MDWLLNTKPLDACRAGAMRFGTGPLSTVQSSNFCLHPGPFCLPFGQQRPNKPAKGREITGVIFELKKAAGFSRELWQNLQVDMSHMRCVVTVAVAK